MSIEHRPTPPAPSGIFIAGAPNDPREGRADCMTCDIATHFLPGQEIWIDDKGRSHTAHPLRLWEKKPIDEVLARINAGIKNPITIDNVAEVLCATIKHDDAVKKTVFLTMLLAYTEADQQNIIMTGESAVGKSWIATQIADLFPREDVIELAYSSPSAFFYEQGKYDKEKNAIIIDMQRRVVLWLDMPHAATLERLRPLLSHDRKIVTYKATDRSERHGHRTKTSQVVGFFTTIFCGATMDLDSQERTRSFLLSPSDSPDKIKETLKLKAQYDTDPAKFEQDLEADEQRQFLKYRIRRIRDLNIRNIKVPFAQELADEWISEHPELKPKHQRDFPRLVALTKALALLNADDRDLDENHDITATKADADEAKRVYAEFAESNEYGLAPHTYDLYTQIIKPLAIDEGATKREIAKAHYKTKHRQIPAKWLDKELNGLITVGLLSVDDTTKPYRYVLNSGPSQERLDQ